MRRVVSGQADNELGRDPPAFREHDPEGLTVGSISNESTFSHDVGDMQAVADRLRSLCERVCWRAPFAQPISTNVCWIVCSSCSAMTTMANAGAAPGYCPLRAGGAPLHPILSDRYWFPSVYVRGMQCDRQLTKRVNTCINHTRLAILPLAFAIDGLSI